MSSWILLNYIAVTNMLGIIMDVAGAYYVASEVVKQFRGDKYESGIGSGPIGGVPTNDAPLETKEFQLYERIRFYRMKVGLALLTIGFLLQFIANAAQIKSVS